MPLRLSPTWISQIEAVVLTGLSTASNALVTATDSILSAFGKLHGFAGSAHPSSIDVGALLPCE